MNNIRLFHLDSVLLCWSYMLSYSLLINGVRGSGV